MIELGFLEPTQAEPVAKLLARPDGCGLVELWVHGKLEGRLEGSWKIERLIEELLGAKL